MFRIIAQRATGSLRSTALSRVYFSANAAAATAPAAPSVKDLLIDLTFVDPSGARRKVTGLVGKTLAEICELHDIELGPSNPAAPPEVQRTDSWIEPTFGEGVSSGYDHVVLVGNGKDTAPRKTPIEEQMLEDYWEADEIYEGSRLASAVVLTKDMNGMTVYVPDRITDDVP
ncbi:hypothetical protein MPSEU_000481000 [Mayamaea pseudoterrestris]|nr:hypothetical protein MPSEU_000481000 [Mayamaea pseudoterrestris]